MKALAATLLIGTFLSTSSALACGFHNSTPVPSMVDRMLESDHIVLAHADPENRFSYKAVEAIEGDLATFEVNMLIDSQTRRRLAVSPDARVLFVKSPDDGTWSRVAFVDAELRPVLAGVFSRLSAWDASDDVERFRVFAGLLNASASSNHLLALRELDQASYGQLKAAVGDVDTTRILGRISLLGERDLRAIRILILGLSDDPDAKALITYGLENQTNAAGRNLGAYATAFLEMTGPSGAAVLVGHYLPAAEQVPDSRELLIEAMALHATYGEEAMRAAVLAAVEKAVRENPNLAASVARQFGSREDWSLSPLLMEALKSGLNSPLDAITVSQYVAMAQSQVIPTD